MEEPQLVVVVGVGRRAAVPIADQHQRREGSDHAAHAVGAERMEVTRSRRIILTDTLEELEIRGLPSHHASFVLRRER
jgi:hypothetical protein